MKEKWSKKYPDKGILRNEVNCMVSVILDVIMNNIPESDIEMIYFKGSAEKEWSTPVDYVPEMSDVDIHISLRDDSLSGKYFNSGEKTLEMCAEIEKLYFSNFKKPVHLPRPQIMILNELKKDIDFIPTPKNSVSILYGDEYPEPDYSDREMIKKVDFKRIEETEDFTERLPLRLIDRPGEYVKPVLREMTWRISPSGPRVLSLLDLPTVRAWSINRTQIISLLKEYGKIELAEYYAKFYLACWDFFLSDYKDYDAGREAVISGLKTLKSSIAVAKSWRIKNRD